MLLLLIILIGEDFGADKRGKIKDYQGEQDQSIRYRFTRSADCPYYQQNQLINKSFCYPQKGLSLQDWPHENGRKEKKTSGILEKARYQKVRKPD